MVHSARTNFGICEPLPLLTTQNTLPPLPQRQSFPPESTDSCTAPLGTDPLTSPRNLSGRPEPPVESHRLSESSRSKLTTMDDIDAVPDSTRRRPIMKPPGQVGRPKRGGYNLRDALGWDENTYKDVQVSPMNHHKHV